MVTAVTYKLRGTMIPCGGGGSHTTPQMRYYIEQGRDKRHIGLIAPPFIIGFLATNKIPKVSSNIAQKSLIWPLESHIWPLFSQIHMKS